MDIPSSNSQDSSHIEKATTAAEDKKPPRPQPEHAEKCPRCDSGNTKFCYYNNYSLSQPRYFCKACRRYWTKGGTLRNVPVGGGCRKNKRSVKRAFDNHHLLVQSQQLLENNNNNNVLLSSASFDHSNFSSPLRYEDDLGTDDSLSLAFATLQKQCSMYHHQHHHLGFEFDPQNSILGHQPVRSSLDDNMGFVSNLFEPQTSSFKYHHQSQSLYNYGFENVGGGAQSEHHNHTLQPLLLDNEDLSLSNNMASAQVFNQINGDLNGNRIFWGQADMNNNNSGLSEKNNTAASSWPNLFNTTALIM